MRDRKAWLRRLPAVTVAVAVIVLLAAAFASRPTLGAFTAQVTGEDNVVGTVEHVSVLQEMQAASTRHNGIYLFQLGDGDGTLLGNERYTNLASGAILGLTTPPAGYNEGHNAATITDTPWHWEERTALRFSSGTPGEGRFYVPDGLLQGLLEGLLTGYPDEFSQEVWFRTDSSGVLFTYTRGTSSYNSSHRLDVTPTGQLQYSVRDPGGLLTRADTASISSFSAVNDGQWHHAVTTFDHATHRMQLYVDGELADQDISPVTPYTPGLLTGLLGSLLSNWNYQYGYDGDSSAYESGLNSDQDRQFAGDIAFVAGYAEVLPADVINNHATVGLP